MIRDEQQGNWGASVKVRHGIRSTTRASTSLTLDLNLSRPLSDVKGFTNAAMAWMPKSGHGADGRLTNHHGSLF
jgi:hypothetical protein